MGRSHVGVRLLCLPLTWSRPGRTRSSPAERVGRRRRRLRGSSPRGSASQSIVDAVDALLVAKTLHPPASSWRIAAARSRRRSALPLAGSLCGLQSRQPARRCFGRRRLWCIALRVASQRPARPGRGMKARRSRLPPARPAPEPPSGRRRARSSALSLPRRGLGDGKNPVACTRGRVYARRRARGIRYPGPDSIRRLQGGLWIRAGYPSYPQRGSSAGTLVWPRGRAQARRRVVRKAPE